MTLIISKLIISRDIIFHDNRFSYHKNLITNPLLTLPCTSVDNDAQSRDINDSFIADLRVIPNTNLDTSPATVSFVQPLPTDNANPDALIDTFFPSDTDFQPASTTIPLCQST